MLKFPLTTRTFFSSYKKVLIPVLFVFLLSIAIFKFSPRALSQISYVGNILRGFEFSTTSLSCKEETRKLVKNISHACVIPQTPVMPEYFKTRWRTEVGLTRNKYDCTYAKRIIEFKDEKTVVLLPEFTHQNCCIQEIVRGVKDSIYDMKVCKEIKENRATPEAEVFAVRCGDSFNMEAGIPMKETVQKKLDHWKDIPVDERPMNVILIGFDSVSRKHAYRSLPKSIETMKKMGFVDFQSYHSVEASTLPNFMEFLMGLGIEEVRLTCAKDWNSPFDSCPFIWKDFDARHYVTSYVEDGEQTFNWGGQSGFVKEPTDYYIHHLFIALEKMRKAQIKKLKLDPKNKKTSFPEDCISTEKVPEFVLRYTQRFIKKFAEVPFFAFTWLAYPFHEDIYALQNYDVPVEQFLQSIMSIPNLSNRTMIIFLSDHGDRTSYFNSESYESFIERGLPPLFIRLPDILKSKLPQASESLKRNSKLLATPLDVHHTLLHALSIFPGPGSQLTQQINQAFNSNLKDRSSLLTTFNGNRTCEDVKITSVRCLCNIEYNNSEDLGIADDYIQLEDPKDKDDDTSNNRGNGSKNKVFDLDDAKIEDSLLKFSVSQLNLKVQMTEYKDACQLWNASSIKNITSTRKLFEKEGFIQVLFGFKANPEAAKFEAILRVPLHSNYDFKADAIQMLSLSRVNEYKNESWCVGSKTDLDKEIKGMCVCSAK